MASKRKQRRDGCAGKRQFSTLDAAQDASFGGNEPYHCKHCRWFHIGHPDRRRRQSLAARRRNRREETS